MKKIFKWLLLGLALLAVLLLAVVITIGLLVDPNDYRDDISRLVQENTGQELVIEGDMELRFIPWLGLDLGRTRLENRQGFGDQPFVQIESAGVAVRVLPLLLRREVVTDVVRLDGLLVHLVVNEQGEANWELDLPETAADTTTEASRRDEPAADGPPPVNIGRLAGVEVNNMQVIFEDRQQGTRQELGPVNLAIGELNVDRDVPVNADWVASLDSRTRIEGSMDALVRVNEALDRINVQLGRLDVTTFAEGLPSSGLTTRVSALADVDLSADTAAVQDLRVDTAGLRLNARADATGLTQDLRVQGNFDIPEASLRNVLEQLGQPVPETSDPDVLKAFSAEGSFNMAGDTARVEDLAVRLDDTRVNGTLSVADFGNPMIGFQLQGDSLNADRYLPAESEQEAESRPVAGEGEPEPAELPMETLRALRLDGGFRLGELVVTGLALRDVNFTVKADNGMIRVHPIGAQLYGGQYNGDIRVDATGEQAQINVNERISNVQAQEIVTALLGRDLLEGTGDLTLQARAAGVEIPQLIRDLTGQAEFRFADGAVSGINIPQMIRGATARLQGESANSDAPQKTDFTEMAGRVVFDGGKVRNENFNAQSPLLRVNGGGEVDMLEQTIDYRLTVNLVGTLTGQDGESLDSLRRLPIPLHFTGNLLSPDISIDLAGALTARQQQRLEEEEQELRERVREEREQMEEKVEERAREELRKLFRR